jgi:uncharacterized protein (TIGR03118 family)
MKTVPLVALPIAASVALALAVIAPAALAESAALSTPVALAGAGVFQQHNLVSDGFVAADHIDANLVNAWGIAFNPNGFVWVANADSGTSTLYDGSGNPQSLVVAIPTPDADTGGKPTGIVYNASSGFTVTKAGVTGPSRFLFATEQGLIAGWAPNVDGTHAVIAVDTSNTSGAIFKGMALSGSGSGQLLYATDFHNGVVDVFDSNFAPVTLPVNAFTDDRLPFGFAPFGIQAIGGDIYVTYAKQDADKEDEVAGAGLGVVDVFDPNGRLLQRVATRGALNAPWGIALAPAGFGRLGGALLIANFGDGQINAFNPVTNTPLGALRGANHRLIEIPGLWGIAFGNGLSGQSVDSLFFTSGPDDEDHGLYGRLDPVTN